MRITVIGTRGFPGVQGGVETHCEQLYSRISSMPCQVTVIARAPYVSYNSLCYRGVNLLAVECPRSKYLEAIVHTCKAVIKAKSLKTDILHIHAIGPSLLAPIARLLGMKVVLTHHGQNYRHKKWGFWGRLCLRLCEFVGVTASDEIIAISDHIAADVATRFNKRATVIPNGVEIPDRAGEAGVLERFGLEKGKYILAVGRLVPDKGFHDLVDAFNALDLKGWKLVIAGRADHEDSYSSRLKKTSALNNNILFIGFLKGEPLHELYSNAGIFVLPSYYEGHSIVLMEALSYGLPCVASDIRSNKIEGIRNVYFYRSGDVNDLAVKIAECAEYPVSDAETALQLSSISIKYNWDRIAEDTFKVYQRVEGIKPQACGNANGSTEAFAIKISVTGLRGFPNIQGGIETHCEQLYTRLADKGCSVSVFVRKPYTGLESTVHKGVMLKPLACSTNKYLETISHTFKSVIKAKTAKSDILHIHAIGPSFFAPLAKALGMKVVVTTHGPDYMRAKWSEPAKLFLKLCEKVGMTYADEVIAIAENIADDLQRRYRRRATVIPNGVEIPAHAESADAVSEFGLEKGKYVLAVGRLVPEKGFHDLIDAFNKSSLDYWKLVIVGGADHEDAYSKGLKDKVLVNSKVVLTGFLKGQPLHELYSHAGLFVIPSYYEGLPIVLLEALSYGLPCIASDIPANKNVNIHPSHFFKVGNIDDLSLKIARFSSEPLSENARKAQIEILAHEYDWDLIADNTLKVYQTMLERRGVDGGCSA